jgi:hypothetical protein
VVSLLKHCSKQYPAKENLAEILSDLFTTTELQSRLKKQLKELGLDLRD